jgi:hypothetical protein
MGVALTALVLAVSGGGAYAFAATPGGQISACVRHKGGGLYLSGKCQKHDKRLSWDVAGRQGEPGSAGAQGQPGIPGKQGQPGQSGPQGPGAVEYTYDSTAPAATPQNTRLGPAGPFSELTGSCTVIGTIVEVSLGETNSNTVDADQTRQDLTNGGTPLTSFASFSQPAVSSPITLSAEANTNNAGDGYNHTTLTVTAPTHGTLDIFEHVSHANNTCHLSVAWTPAS